MTQYVMNTGPFKGLVGVGLVGVLVGEIDYSGCMRVIQTEWPEQKQEDILFKYLRNGQII